MGTGGIRVVKKSRASRISTVNANPGFEPGGPQAASGLTSFRDQLLVAMFVSSCRWARGVFRLLLLNAVQYFKENPYKSQKREN